MTIPCFFPLLHLKLNTFWFLTYKSRHFEDITLNCFGLLFAILLIVKLLNSFSLYFPRFNACQSFKAGYYAGSQTDPEVCAAHVLPLALPTAGSGPIPEFAFTEEAK